MREGEKIVDGACKGATFWGSEHTICHCWFCHQSQGYQSLSAWVEPPAPRSRDWLSWPPQSGGWCEGEGYRRFGWSWTWIECWSELTFPGHSHLEGVCVCVCVSVCMWVCVCVCVVNSMRINLLIVGPKPLILVQSPPPNSCYILKGIGYTSGCPD